MAKSKHHIEPTKIKTIILSIVIAIVLSAFVIYLINSIYPNPQYNDFCNEMKPLPQKIQENCSDAELKDNCCIDLGYEYYNETTHSCETTCYDKYDKARDKHDLITFIVAVIAGLATVTIGILISLTSVSSGLMLGGTFLTFYGTAVYWSNLNNWIRTILLGAVLAILIWLGYKKLQN